jgi:hypothetical protein
LKTTRRNSRRPRNSSRAGRAGRRDGAKNGGFPLQADRHGVRSHQRMPIRSKAPVTAAAAAWGLVSIVSSGQAPISPAALRNHPAIAYQTRTPDDPVARLDARLARGEATLTFDSQNGYLRSVLDQLQVPTESQLLVYSKTSFQAPRIGPSNPRALYFNDTVSVGWVRGGEVLEFAAHDPSQGTIFYTLDQRSGASPRFTRQVICVQCHTWEATLDVPGTFVGSVVPAHDGSVLYVPAYSIDHRTPFDLRWGGWFVTGRHALPRHLGNALVPAGGAIEDVVTPASVHVTSLEGRFDRAGYAGTLSDIVALLVIEHQARMLNLITRAGWEARVGADAGRPLSAIVNELVDYLLFVDEQPLPGAVEGPSAFARVFTAQGPRDSRGRSLRDLDLRTRLMRYPCSYLIYSEPFDALPQAAKQAVYARLWAVLSGAVRDARYDRLTADDRQAVLDILRETKPDLPAYFGEGRPPASG